MRLPESLDRFFNNESNLLNQLRNEKALWLYSNTWPDVGSCSALVFSNTANAEIYNIGDSDEHKRHLLKATHSEK